MRRVLVIICIILSAFGSLAVAYGDTIPDQAAVEYAGAELSPFSEIYQLWGWNVVRYYYFLYVHLFADYPWVVRIAYGVIIICCLAFILLGIAMMVDVYIRWRNWKKLVEIEKLYLEKLKSVCYADVENLSTDEIMRRMEYKPRKWKNWEMRQWAYVFVEASMFTNTQNPNLTNIQRAMKMIGFTEYVESKLLHGKRSEKLRIIQTVRLTNMQLPNSTVTRLVNEKDDKLRMAARLYYMCTSKDDPYLFFEEETMKGMRFSLWDMMELHEIFHRVKEGGGRPPLFVPILQRVVNPKILSFMIEETGYWGTDQEMRYIMDFFESDDFNYRRSAFRAMGIHRFAEAEKSMERSFHKQNENLRREILNSLLVINSGRAITFFRDTYNSSISSFTRRTALRCLWMSGASGRAVFDSLQANAKENEKILFQHVESPIINYEEA